MKHLLTSVSAIGLTFAASPALAQDTPTAVANPAGQNADDNRSELPDIVVTAQKRSERLQDVPVAVSVVSGDTLTKLSTNNIEDAARLVPALTFVKGTTGLNSALFLRGLGTTNFSIAAEPSVSTVLDGVVLARAGEAFGDLYDIERIEVLRGPQGTLFGKNASAGVINVVTKEPGDTLGGYVDLGYFGRSEYKAKASVGGPIGGGWKAGVTGFYGKYDGNLYNRTKRDRVNGYRHYGGRVQVVGEIASTLKLRLLADYRNSDDDCCAFVVGAVNPTTAIPAVISVLAPIRGAATRDIVQSRVTRTTEETWGASLQADLSLGKTTLTSITSYRKWNNTEVRDGSWVDQVYTTVPLIYDTGPQKSSTFTQELRLTSPTGGLIDYVLGAFYYRAKARRIYTRSDTYCTASPAAPLANGLVPCPAGSTILNPVGSADFGSVFENYAAFGQATLNVTNQLRFVAGLRYTHDNVSVDHIRRNNYTGNAFPGLVGAPAGIGPSFDQGVYNFALANAGAYGGSNGAPFTARTSNDNLSGKAAVEFAFNKQHMAYVSYARGYKGPAFNVFFNFQYFNSAPIAAELSDSFEVGLKNSMFGGRVILNLAAFYAKVKNYQSNFPTTVNGAVTTTIINAGDVSTRGAEADWLVRLAPNFTINGGVSYTDARVDFFRPPPAAQAGNAISRGTPLAFAPKLRGSLGVNYTIEPASLPFGIELGAQATFTDKQISGLQATNTTAQIQLRGAQTIPAYEQVDLTLAAVGADNRYRVAFIVKNVFNTHYASTIATGGPGGSLLYQIPRDADRYFGVTGRVNF
ncbi:MAG: TonB-dependent receptor [Sphingomonas sp.]